MMPELGLRDNEVDELVEADRFEELDRALGEALMFVGVEELLEQAAEREGRASG